ncbi:MULTISPECIES: TonB-dependent receptor domain-containing protein [unclassified Luteimonas]
MSISIGRCLLLGVIAAAASSAAYAQEQGAGDDPVSLDTVSVTGSRIRGAETVGSHVIGFDREQIEMSSSVTTTDILREIPQVINLGTDESHKGSQNAQLNSTNASGINLRGIGGSTTLPLINGRRVVPSGTQGQYMDPSIIPTLALERIEVLADGASALYGSDAIAGVVNLITREQFEGHETRIRYGAGDGLDRFQFGHVSGFSWDSGNVMVAFEHTERSELEASDRSFYRQDLTPFGGMDYRANQCNPGTLVVGGQTYALPPGNGVGIDPASLVAGTGTGTGNLCDSLESAWLLPRQERHSIYIKASQDLGERLRLRVENLYSKREFKQVSGGRTASIALRNTNPYFISPVPGASSVSVNYMMPAEEFGLAQSQGQARVRQWTVGLDAQLWGDWNGAFNYVYGNSLDVNDARNIVNAANLAVATSTTDPSLALNPFGSGANSPQSVYDFLRGSTYQPPSSTMRMFEAQADGSLFEMWGGNARIAVGVEHREDELYTATLTFRPGSPEELREATVGRDVSSAYAEAYLPFVGAQNERAGIHRLDLSLAMRYDRYSDFGSTTNPKVGITYAPTRAVALRATYGESFRAPSLSELDASNNVLYQRTRIDPTAPSGQSLGVILAGGNPGLGPEMAKTWTAGIDWKPESIPGLFLNATYWSVDYSGQVVDLFTVNDVLIREPVYADHIIRNPTLDQVNSLMAAYRLSGAINPATTEFILDARRQNLAITRASGIDLSAGHVFELGRGNLRLNANATYYNEYETLVAAGADATDVLNTINYPVDLSFRGNIGWFDQNWNTRLSFTHIGGYRNTTSSRQDKVGSWSTADFYLGYQFDYGKGWVTDGLTLSLDVQNLLDRSPNFVDTPGGYDGEKASALGRIFTIGVAKNW